MKNKIRTRLMVVDVFFDSINVWLIFLRGINKVDRMKFKYECLLTNNSRSPEVVCHEQRRAFYKMPSASSKVVGQYCTGTRLKITGVNFKGAVEKQVAQNYKRLHNRI